ncbi:hypothetical protein GT347_21820 [Xylophilus rhododendri]|uniref:Uncharacterized protein n=1 Tax=Xylophilus rhododendri TaxID=2697032 RepID=A0A857JB03_9BURK|nr:fatty acyl-AMP ligase [Xylophilus rhododendri]QHJ00384.1 hypothetical protein GT347_21820 [Xylophilus rhododendri]
MSEKLHATWTAAVRKHCPADLDDKALEKLLEAKDMARALEGLKSAAARPDGYLDALASALTLIEKVRGNARKHKKTLGDPAFKAFDKTLDDLHTEAEASQKKAAAAAKAEAAKAGDEEPDSPVLLTSKMLPLVRELRKGELEMSALVCTAGNQCAVLIMRRAIAPGRRKLLSDALNVSGGAKFFAGTVQWQDKALTFQFATPVASLAKKVRQAMLAQTDLRLKVKIAGPDGVGETDGENEAEEDKPAAGTAPVTPPANVAANAAATTAPDAGSQAEPEPVRPSANDEKRFRDLAAELEIPLQQALRGRHPDADKLRMIMSVAQEKAQSAATIGGAIAALGKIREMLKPQAHAEQPAANAAASPVDDPVTRGKVQDALVASGKRFEATLNAVMGPLTGAMAFPEVGGDAVASAMAEARALAARGDHAAAEARIKDAARDAVKVMERAPYARAIRLHQGNIKAAFGIAHQGKGAAFKKAWEVAVKQAAAGDYAAAAPAVLALAREVGEVREDKALIEIRDKVRGQRDTNDQAIAAGLKDPDFGIDQLRALVINEIGGPGVKSLAAQAAEAGDDAGAKSREAMKKPATAEANFKTHDWFKLKEMLHAGEIDKEDMWDCWRFRQQYVTAEIDKLRKTYPTLIAKTSGSSDLESDIDITFASTKPGDDVLAARDFNALVLQAFKKPPGRVFDVNIYPRDYNAIKESINAEYNAEAVPDRNIDQPTGEMQKLSRVDQDVATLLKQRRFLDAAAYDALMQQVIDGSPAEVKAQVQKQFEEGEDIYLLTAQEKVQKILAKLPADRRQGLPKVQEYLATLDTGGSFDLEKAKAAQRLLPLALDELEARLPNEVMLATDEMYLDKMATMREDQTRIQALQNPAGAVAAQHPGGDCETIHPGQSHEEWRAAESERLKARVKKDQFTNIIFANEAYMSQGAIEHIVAGLQAADEATKQKMLAQLTPATLMQSCNEQLADFFKDMKAVEGGIATETDETKKRRETGEAFVHASKYLVRLLDAAQLLYDKFDRFVPKVPLRLNLLTVTGFARPIELQKKVESVLLALRKSSAVPADAKGEVGFDEASQLFKVRTIGEFRKLITDFGTELNLQVRGSPQFQAELAVDEDTERRFFGVPDMPAALQQEVDAARRLVAAKLQTLPRHGELAAILGESEGEVLAARELVQAAGRAPAPHDLPEQVRQTTDRAQAVLERLRAPASRAVLELVDRMVLEAGKLSTKLQAPAAADLHEAHRQVRQKLVTDLARQIGTLKAGRDSLQQDYDRTEAELAQALADLRALA